MRARPVLRRRRAGLALVALAAVGPLAAVVSGPPAYAADAPIACREVATPDDVGAEPPQDAPSYPDPFAEMGIADAAGLVHGTPGEGVTIAVVDSGIDPKGLATTPERPSFGGQPPAAYFHGTSVAGLIAGRKGAGSPGGIAPGAHLVDLPVLSPPSEAHPEGRVEVDAVVAALRYLGDHLGRYPRLVVSMSMEFSQDVPALRQQVERLIRRGAVVVAASGNRVTGDSPDEGASASPYAGDEDADDRVFPAAYPGVVAVGAVVTEGSAGDATPYVVANSRTDVVAPTYGARSVTLGGRPCVIDEVTTSWSTAEVSGVLALLASAEPHATGPELVDRLVRTASGRPDVPGRFTGAGVVQAYDALTRPLGPSAGPSAAAQPAARVAPPERDVLESTRHSALWWGLLGGGALIVGLVLRPLLSRRR